MTDDEKKWVGFGRRISQRLRELGYINRRGEPDVFRFSLEHKYHPNYLYRWIKHDTTPERDNLFRLARDLDVHPAWLLFGDELTSVRPAKPRRPRPSISGGSGLGTLEDHLQVIYYRQQRLAQMRLIGSWPRDRSRPMGWSIHLDRAA